MDVCMRAKGCIFQKLQELPNGCPPCLDDDYLRLLNQLLSSGTILVVHFPSKIWDQQLTPFKNFKLLTYLQ
ncbi:hypothetical protein BDA96_06G256700 [Sorghum bicolor]|uniref:Uncharacterized protein n=2 Tax=Sorghum bicolor TaxID=4558 RepID=A0A921UDP4_SORBI|nr:hypothetical protein BDA96_06G256700 [Sorghum bicolor]OQU82418.1 hypothetical protein SORBI_3006G234601 [Sorghum bicolor]